MSKGPGHWRCRALAALAFALPAPLLAQSPSRAPLVPFEVVGDAIPASLTGVPGDAARGRAIVVDRRTGMCLLCHAGPFPEERFQGTIGPDLRGVGVRLDEAQLRLRIVDAQLAQANTTMPSYYRVDGLTRVGTAWRGRPILSAQQVEDVVALLASLGDQAKPETR